MFRKHISLVLTLLLPVSVLVLGFVTKQAIGNNPIDEVFTPANCQTFYRNTFGSEVSTSALCNVGVLEDTTDEWAWLSSVNYTLFEDPEWETWDIQWNRNQQWTFRDNQPWGTDSCYVSMQRPYLYRQFDEEQVWTGSESHWMVGNPPNWHAWSEADWYRWMDREEDGVGYICVEARSYHPNPGGLIDINCTTGEKVKGGQGYYDSCTYNAFPWPHTIGGKTQTWYNCVTFDDFF